MIQPVDLHRFRREKKLKQQDVADATGIDRARISKYENGKEVTEYVHNLIIEAYPESTEYISQVAHEPVEKYKKGDDWFSSDIDGITTNISLLQLELLRLESLRKTKKAELQEIDRQIQSTKDMIDNKDWTS